MAPRTLVIGLDCAPPALVFERYRADLPHISELMRAGTWGRMRSSAPPITVPAWTCMVSGRDPGELGLYGFRNRVRGSYDLRVATGDHVQVKRIWDWLGEAGKRVAPLFVPLTWPAPPVRGALISGFLGPDGAQGRAFPPRFLDEVEARFGPYLSDVEDFRSGDSERILKSLYEMGEQHFGIAEWVWREREPDFLMMVEMGTDRLHHALWHHMDPSHPSYVEGHALERAARDYYRWIDERVGRLIALADDETAVVIVSDHGARSMRGAFLINEWLRQNGWLRLLEEPARPGPLKPEMIDWSGTRAWSTGGYYARVFMNVAGRDPEGVISPEEYEGERERLRVALDGVIGPDGAPLRNQALRPESMYRETRGFPPDLMLFLDDLDYRAVGTVGANHIFTAEDDRGHDGCNHDWDGVFIMGGGRSPTRGEIHGIQIYDFARTVLGLMDVSPPADILGRDLSQS